MKLLIFDAINAGEAHGSAPPWRDPVSTRWWRVSPVFHQRVWAVAILMLLSIQVSEAHRDHGVWTELVWSEDRFEITHHMHLQDAQRVLERLSVDVSLDSPEGLAQLALYVEGRFSLSERGESARLVLIGAETEGDFLYVFQEWHGSRGAEIPQIASTLLKDIHPNAVTWVRIEAPELNQTWSVDGDNSNSSSYTSQ